MYPTADSVISKTRYNIFHFMWCMFLLIHQSVTVSYWVTIGDEWLQSGNEFYRVCAILTVVFLIVSLFNRKKPLYFVLALMFWTILKANNLPFVPNHIVLAMIINLTIMSSYLWLCLLRKAKDIVEFVCLFAPYLRYMLLILYFFTVFHKLNLDYFNPEVSCGASLYKEILVYLPFLPSGDWIIWLVIVGTLVVEILIPVLIQVRKFAMLGVTMGIAFHFVLALHPNPQIFSFSSEVYALYILFLPAIYLSKIVTTVSITIKKYRSISLTYQLLGPFIFIITCYWIGASSVNYTFLWLNNLRIIAGNYGETLRVVWYFWAITLLIFSFYLSLLQKIEYTLVNKIKETRWSFLILFLMITFLNGISPYVGLKTATNFSMFSNLYVQGSENNHLFIPSIALLGGYQDDMVEIIDSNDGMFKGLIENKERVTFFEFQRRLQNSTADMYVDFNRKEEFRRIKLPEDTVLVNSTRYSFLENKLLVFRNVPISGPCLCQW